MEETLLLVIIIISSLLCFAYFNLIASYCYASIKMPLHKASGHSSKTLISVIIAARNEEKNIEKCLSSILHQSYPSEYLEIIVVDDASEDATSSIIQRFCKKHDNLKLISLPNAGSGGKKNALGLAIKEAKGELIVSTDADCNMDKNWLSTIISYYHQTNAKLIVAPVSFYNETSIFGKMQSLEFMALVFSGGASLYFNKAIMCNGANLAYPKHIFHKVNGFKGIDDQPSGDDVLLMYKIFEKYPNEIHFLKNKDAIVYTEPKPTLSEFINQRKRWTSKGFNILNKETKKVSLIVYLFNLSLLMLAILSLFYSENKVFNLSISKILLILFGIKCIIDFLLLFLSASFFGKRKFLIYFLPEQILYILYIVAIGWLGLFSKYEWKGRKFEK